MRWHDRLQKESWRNCSKYVFAQAGYLHNTGLMKPSLSLFESGGMRDFFIWVHYRWVLFVNGGIGAASRVTVNRDKLRVSPGHCNNLSGGRSSIQIHPDQQQQNIDHAG